MFVRSRFISLPSSAHIDQPVFCKLGKEDILNLTPKVAGSLLCRGSILDSIFMPSERASGGMRERKSRAGFERGEKGLKVTRTSVRNLVIMAAMKRDRYKLAENIC